MRQDHEITVKDEWVIYACVFTVVHVVEVIITIAYMSLPKIDNTKSFLNSILFNVSLTILSNYDKPLSIS